MKIAENILNILADSRIEGNTLFLPPAHLERKVYESVNKCLVAIGGKWNRKTKGHVFEIDPTEAFENLILTGETEDMKKTFQFFPTPRPVAEIACDMAELKNGLDVLEPSCGKGDLADVIYERAPEHLICNELNRDMERYLRDKPYTCMYGDFLEMQPCEINPFDRIVMNPPFSKQQDIDHVYRAYDLLKSGGILVSVMSTSAFWRGNVKSVQFREWLDNVGAEIVDVDAGAFKSSGTMVAAKIVKVQKP